MNIFPPSFTFVYNNTEPQHFNILLLDWEFLEFGENEYTQLMTAYTRSLYYVTSCLYRCYYSWLLSKDLDQLI